MKTKYEVNSSNGQLLFHVDRETGKLIIESSEDKIDIDYIEAEKMVSAITKDFVDFENEELKRRSRLRNWLKKWKI